MSKKERESGRKWDGVSRVSTNQYKKNWEEIYGQREQEELKASYKQSLANKKEREQKEIEEKLWHNLKEWNLKKKEPKTRLEQMEMLTHDPIVD